MESERGAGLESAKWGRKEFGLCYSEPKFELDMAS